MQMKIALLASVAAVFSSEICETVTIQTENGPVRVNKSDYDADQAEGGAKSMTLATEKQAAPVADAETQTPQTVGQTDGAGAVVVPADGLTVPPAPSAPVNALGGDESKVATPNTLAPNTLLVIKDGKKFYVVRPTGEKVTDVEGIDAAGYASEEAARNAINALPH